ncbi:hypothetical protein VNO77_02841 [Canavalia gladiata]|uniref:RING-type E3 ubiquitin transferase n=1 Tax=Canavalia gladiata TaxID=3824 RepID=A0AAN9MUH0_CANGL
MAGVGNPRTWIPYMNSKDCSQGFCSLYCPQWCYIVYPPPPPFEYPDDDSSPNFSPLVIAIIGILVTAFLLVSYYTLISKYCGPRESAHRDPNDELQDNHHSPSLHEPWHASTMGLDEAQIKSIQVFKYKKGGEGFNFGGISDCSVCLSEFQDNESVRLLPKCNHAFHLPCIDTWLKSHSSCPLCRATIFTFNASVQVPQVEVPSSRNETTSSENQQNVGDEFGIMVVEEESVHHDIAYPKPALRAFSDLSSTQGRNHRVIEIRDEVCESIGRSASMDHSFQIQSVVSVADVLHMNDEEEDSRLGGCYTEAGPSKRSRGESSKFGYRRKVLRSALSPIAMKRSFSGGRFSIGQSGRRKQGIIPI